MISCQKNSSSAAIWVLNVYIIFKWITSNFSALESPPSHHFAPDVYLFCLHTGKSHSCKKNSTYLTGLIVTQVVRAGSSAAINRGVGQNWSESQPFLLLPNSAGWRVKCNLGGSLFAFCDFRKNGLSTKPICYIELESLNRAWLTRIGPAAVGFVGYVLFWEKV